MKNIENVSIDEQLDEVKGNFILCGKPIYDDNDQNLIVEWQMSAVRIDLIKTIHNNNKFTGKDKPGCIFYTYKNEWYVCAICMRLLTEVINEFYQLKGFGDENRIEITGNKSGKCNLSKVKGNLFSGNAMD